MREADYKESNTFTQCLDNGVFSSMQSLLACALRAKLWLLLVFRFHLQKFMSCFAFLSHQILNCFELSLVDVAIFGVDDELA